MGDAPLLWCKVSTGHPRPSLLCTFCNDALIPSTAPTCPPRSQGLTIARWQVLLLASHGTRYCQMDQGMPCLPGQKHSSAHPLTRRTNTCSIRLLHLRAHGHCWIPFPLHVDIPTYWPWWTERQDGLKHSPWSKSLWMSAPAPSLLTGWCTTVYHWT